jgi:hypothetical protein
MAERVRRVEKVLEAFLGNKNHPRLCNAGTQL